MRVNSDFVIRNIMDEYVIVPVGEQALNFGALLTTNDVGARIWKCLQKDTTLEEIINTICEEFDGEEDAITADVKDFLKEVEKNGLLIQ